MIIKSHFKDYTVSLNNSFEEIININYDEKTFIVVDKVLYELYGEKLFKGIPKKQLYLIEAIEKNKTIETALDICELMTNIPAKRNCRLISFGGGIVQDITGFVANVLYRGITWIFFPTTLLAACDSCIGGKTSLNYKSYKNLLGTFYPPDEIKICTPFFKTLSEKDFTSGLGEVVKFNVMFGTKGIENLEKNIDFLLQRNDDVLMQFTESSLEFKKNYIEEDEFDKGVRINLNFAHTFGHAFETISNYYIPHGTAVALGTVVANRISLSRGWLEKDKVLRVENIIKRIVSKEYLGVEFELDSIIAAMRKDKKQINKDLTAVLMYDDMKLRIVHDLQIDEVNSGISAMLTCMSK